MKRILSVFLTLLLLVGLCMPVYAQDSGDAQAAAEHLHALGLFQGTGTDADGDPVFDLGRAPKRTEAVTMLVRLLGKEDEAKSSTWTTPFTDVPNWAKPYVGYAYENGLTKGIDPNDESKFGSDTPATARMYITFVLRSLGYSDDAGGDFQYKTAWEFSDALGITDGSYNASTDGAFTRGDAAIVSDSALEALCKDSEDTLLDKLIADGAVKTDEEPPAEEEPSVEPAEPVDPSEKTALDSEQIYAHCMPAVFYIEVYDDYGDAIASGSGFFIDGEGTAVTNHHVIYGATSAKVTLSDSAGNDLETLDVLGVYDWSEEEDWAVLQVDITGNSYLPIGDPATAAGGAKVYALGSPLGLSASISDGMISNPARLVDGQTYIQISAPISHGSSGGALVNKYGEVIGITAAGFDDGQNLNLAVPITKIAGAAHDLLTPIADTYTIPSGIVYPAERYVTLRPGQTLDDVITAKKFDTDELLTVQYEIDDETLVSCSWDGWGPDDTEVTLHLTAGENYGSTTVWIYLFTADSGALLDYDYIHVTVAGGELEANKDYVEMELDGYGIVWFTAHCFDSRTYKLRFTGQDSTLINCEWGSWDDTADGRKQIPLYMAALSSGSTYITVEMFDADTGEILATTGVSVSVIGGYLNIDVGYAEVPLGGTLTVNVSGTPVREGAAVYIATDEAESSVIDWQRGKLDGNPATITITGLSVGTDYIFVTLCDADGNTLCSTWIDVDVLAGSVTAETDELALRKGETATVWFDTAVHDGRQVKYSVDTYDYDCISCNVGSADASGRIPVAVTGLDYGSAYVSLAMYDAETGARIAADGFYLDILGGALSFSEKELMLAPGESKTVTITGTPFDSAEAVYIETDQFPSDTIDWQRGKLEGNPAQLTITAKAEGYDLIVVSLYNASDKRIAEEIIDVYVNMDGKGAGE